MERYMRGFDLAQNSRSPATTHRHSEHTIGATELTLELTDCCVRVLTTSASQRVSACILNLPRRFFHRPMETDLASATCAGRQRLCCGRRPTLSEPLDGINRRLWFFHCASGSFAAQPTSVPSAAATATNKCS